MNEELDLKKKVKNLIEKKETISSIASELKLPVYKIISINEELEREKKEQEDSYEINEHNEIEYTDEIILSDEELREHENKGEDLKVLCLDCNTSNLYDKNEISEIIEAPATKKFFGRLFGRLICSKCQSPRMKFSDSNGKIIFDYRHFRICSICADAITIPRLEKLNKTNVCVLCADTSNDYSKFHDRMNNPTPICPTCNHDTVLFTNYLDNTKKIYCSKFSSKDNFEDNDNVCNWSKDYVSKEELGIQEKKYYADLRTLRLKHAKAEVVHPQSLLTNIEISKLANLMPNNDKKLFSITYKNNAFVKRIEEEIIEIFKGR